MKTVIDFSRVCQDEYALVHSFLLRLTNNAQLADELTQETFYQAMQHWRSFRGDCAPATWLCAIAKRQYFTWCRAPRQLPLSEANSPAGHDPEDMLIAREDRQRIHRALHELPEPYKEVVTLRAFGELSHTEIGALFKRPASWSRTIYFRGKLLLAQDLRAQDEEAATPAETTKRRDKV